MQSIGAKFTVYLASVRRPSSFTKKGDDPDNCMIVLTMASARYTAKNWHVKLMVQPTAGLTGGGLSPQISLGPSIMKTPTHTVAMPPYNIAIATYRTADRIIAGMPPTLVCVISKFPSESHFTFISPVKIGTMR